MLCSPVNRINGTVTSRLTNCFNCKILFFLLGYVFLYIFSSACDIDLWMSVVVVEMAMMIENALLECKTFSKILEWHFPARVTL